MSYRNITVNDKKYQYVVGKSHTKIKGVGVFLNEAIGESYVDDDEENHLNVTPACIRKVIENGL